MPSNTPNRDYNRPDAGVSNWNTPLNENFTDLDTDIQDLFDNKASTSHDNSSHSTNFAEEGHGNEDHSTTFLDNLPVLDSGTSVNDFTSINFASGLNVSDAGSGQANISTSSQSTGVYIGKFIISSTGNKDITGVPFEPDMVEFHVEAPVDGYNTEDPGTGNGNTTDNVAGTGYGFARNDGGSTVQQVISSTASGNSINAIRHYSSDSNCIGVSYGDNNGSEVGQVDASLSSWNSDGFTLNVGTVNLDDSGVVVIYKAYNRV